MRRTQATQWLALSLVAALVAPLNGQLPGPQQKVTLYVIDFDNLEGDDRLDWLSKALKDMVLLKMEPEERIEARDAGSIRPFLEAREGRGITGQVSNSLLMMGSYHRRGALLVIDLQLLDLRDWTNLAAATVEAPYGQIPEVNRTLTSKVLEMMTGLDYFSAVDLQAPVTAQERAASQAEVDFLDPTLRYGDQAPAVSREMLLALDDLEQAMDVYSGFQQEPKGTRQAGNVYYREFSLEGEGSLPAERARNTALFEQLIERVAQNPYEADLGELGMEVDPYDNNRIYLNIPVSYRIKMTLVEDLLYALPYVATREQGRLRFFTYDKSKFNFSPSLLAGIARGDFRIIPVVQLLDQEGRIRAVIIDSPDMSWERYFPRGSVPVLRQRNFFPMLAITTSGYTVDVRMETADLDTHYRFEVEAQNLPRIARVAVVFMKEADLLRFLKGLEYL